MAMTLFETTIAVDSIHMRFADQEDEPREWIDFQVPLAPLRFVTSSSGHETDLGPPEKRNLATIREAALRYVLDAISAEIRRA